ncbi:hypothetical protein CYMTET_28699, partial [Cymbomonas tetramitiformis]
HNGGIYVYDNIGSIVRPQSAFPRRSALAQANLALARVLAWNDSARERPIVYGNKLAFKYVHVLEVVEHPLAAAARRRLVGEMELASLRADIEVVVSASVALPSKCPPSVSFDS